MSRQEPAGLGLGLRLGGWFVCVGVWLWGGSVQCDLRLSRYIDQVPKSYKTFESNIIDEAH